MKYEHLPHIDKQLIRMNVVVFSGAGISKESGIDTFRDEDGLWKKYDYAQIATPEGFDANPKLVLDFYNERRRNLLNVKPNHAHLMLAELEQWHDVTIITQNVDDLHERAGSSHVIHIHGELKKVTSSENRLDPNCIKDYPLDVPIKVGDKAADGSQLRPFVVWFGEYLSGTSAVCKLIQDADIFLVIGTSLTVSPAANLIYHAHPEVPKFFINPEEVSIPSGIEYIKAKATDGIDTFIDRVIELTSRE